MTSPQKTVADSQVTFTQVVFPKDVDALGHAPAGYVLKLIDIVASFAARRHTEMNQVTASLDVMNFASPILVWDVVSATAKVTQVWTTSQEVQVTVTAQDYETQESRPIAQGFLTFVSLDANMKPTKAPGITFVTEEDCLMAQSADLRRQYRMLERKQGTSREDIAISPLSPTNETVYAVTRLMTPDDANVYQNVFGGVILEATHEAARQAAVAHANTHVTTVRQDRMNFEQPAVIGEILEARAVVTRAWGSSLEAMTEVYARENTDGSSWRLIAHSYLVFVALDANGNPKTVPTFEPVTNAQKQRWAEADQRRSTRLSELRTQRAFRPEAS